MLRSAFAHAAAGCQGWIYGSLWARARLIMRAHSYIRTHKCICNSVCGWNCPKSHTRRLCKLAISMQDEKSLRRDILVSLCFLYAFIPREVPHSGCMCWAESWGSKEQWHLSRTRSLLLPHGRHFYFAAVLLQYTLARSLSLSRTHTHTHSSL